MLHYINLMSIEESVNVKGGSVVFFLGMEGRHQNSRCRRRLCLGGWETLGAMSRLWENCENGRSGKMHWTPGSVGFTKPPELTSFFFLQYGGDAFFVERWNWPLAVFFSQSFASWGSVGSYGASATGSRHHLVWDCDRRVAGWNTSLDSEPAAAATSRTWVLRNQLLVQTEGIGRVL